RRLPRSRRRAPRQGQTPRSRMKHVTNLSAEPITAELRACLEQVANLPGARIVKRRGHLFLQSGRFEILAERLCALKTRWSALVEHAPIADEDKWRIFALLMAN